MLESVVAKLVKHYDVTGAGQSLIHLFTFSLIVTRDRAPDLLEQGRLTDSTHVHVRLVFVRRRGAERTRENANDVVLKVKRSGKRKWIFLL